jgi:hypothetical protein
MQSVSEFSLCPSEGVSQSPCNYNMKPKFKPMSSPLIEPVYTSAPLIVPTVVQSSLPSTSTLLPLPLLLPVLSTESMSTPTRIGKIHLSTELTVSATNPNPLQNSSDSLSNSGEIGVGVTEAGAYLLNQPRQRYMFIDQSQLSLSGTSQ